MNQQTDAQLLGIYAENRSEAAFTELVRRHVDFTYSAALRMVRDPHLAEDVTQGVFVALAKSAAQLTERPVLSGWLHRTAQNIAAQTVRTIERRRAREQEAAAMNELLSAESESSWQTIAPHLDDALSELDDTDRDALLLRYFEKKSAPEMAGILGISAEAAQKRVSRAVDRLREFFSKRNVTIGASGLVVLISANAIQAAPAGLIITISAAALAGTAVATSTTAIAVTKTVAMTTLQKILVTATVAVLAGTGAYEAKQATAVRVEFQALQQQRAALSGQFLQLQQERDAMTNELAELQVEKSRLQSNSNQTELLKLRGEVALLHQNADALEKLKQENLQLRSQLAAGAKSPSVKPPPDVAPQDLFPRGSWAAAGYADPRSAFQSAVLAVTKGDAQAYAASLSPDMLQAKQKEVADRMALTGKSLDDLAAETVQQYSAVSGYRILDEQTVADDEVVLHVYLDGVGVEKFIRMKKFGTDWKMDAAP